jgi:predicted nucleic acid-binding protein
LPILIDTSVLLASATPRETHHLAAAAAIRAAQPEALGIPLTILTETLSLIRVRYGLGYQRRLWDGVRVSGIDILYTDEPLLEHARDIDERYADAGFGFVDCTLLAACEEHRIARVLSFDRRLAAYRPTFAPGLEVLP